MLFHAAWDSIDTGEAGNGDGGSAIGRGAAELRASVG
jgi:hypothetical protein